MSLGGSGVSITRVKIVRARKIYPPGSLTASFPLKSYRNSIGKDRLPTTIFQGRAVKLRGCTFSKMTKG